MNPSTILPIAVPIFSGLTYLAYKHPEGYARLFKTLSRWIFPIMLLTLGYLIGKQDVARLFTLAASSEVAAKATAIQKDVDQALTIVALYIGGAWLYLFILTFLPELTQPQNTSNQPAKTENPSPRQEP